MYCSSQLQAVCRLAATADSAMQLTVESKMRELTLDEIQEVSGGANELGVTVGKVALTSGGAALGSYFAAARFGATLGSVAGPIGGVVGGLAGATAAYIYYKYNTSE